MEEEGVRTFVEDGYLTPAAHTSRTYLKEGEFEARGEEAWGEGRRGMGRGTKRHGARGEEAWGEGRRGMQAAAVT